MVAPDVVEARLTTTAPFCAALLVMLGAAAGFPPPPPRFVPAPPHPCSNALNIKTAAIAQFACIILPFLNTLRMRQFVCPDARCLFPEPAPARCTHETLPRVLALNPDEN